MHANAAKAPLFIRRGDTDSRWGAICAAALSAVGFAALIATAIITIRSYSPYLVWDQWDQVGFLMELRQHHNLLIFWNQHNEHRLPIQRFLCVMDMLYFGGTNKSLLIETFLVQCCHAGLLIWVAKTFADLSRTVLIGIAGVVTFCLFSPLQIEVFYWGFETTFVLVSLAASAAFACLLYVSTIEPHRSRRCNAILALSIVCCFVSEVSLASGILSWPLLLLLAFTLRLPRHYLATIAVTGVLAIFAYYAHYHTPTYNSNPLQTIRQPGRVLGFVVGCLSYSWDASPVKPLGWPRFSQAVTLIAMFLGSWAAVKCFVTRTCSRFEVFISTNLMFTLATAVVTALGRIRYGYEHAETSRYQTIALMFWACIGLFLASRAARYSTDAVRLAQIAIAVALVSAIPRWSDMENIAIDHKAQLRASWIALSHREINDRVLFALYPFGSRLPEWFDYMQANHLGAKAADPGTQK